MGTSSSKETRVARRPVLFGEAGEFGFLLGVYHDHNMTSVRSRGEQRRDSIIAVCRDSVNVYNSDNGDRRVRLRSPHAITSVDYGKRSSFGPIVLVGTENGEVLVYEMITFTCFKVISTTVDVPVSVTAIVCHPSLATSSAEAQSDSKDLFYVGHSDGTVRSYELLSGGKVKDYKATPVQDMDDPSSPPASGRVNAVSAITIFGGSRPVLAVGHANGDIHTYEVASGQWLNHFRVEPNISSLVPATRFNTLLISHEEQNTVVLWDLGSEQSLKLDFTSEIAAALKHPLKMTTLRFDNARSIMFSGADDGSVLVRRLDRDPATGSYAVKLLRCFNPSTSATTPSRVTSMSYDTHLDRLYTGDMSGIARIVRKVTGVSYEDTDAGTTALGNGSFRMRTDSTASFAGDIAGAGAGAGGGMGGSEGPGRPVPEPVVYRLDWAGGHVDVEALGGMVVPKFILRGGQQVSPMFVAAWSRDPESQRLPPILRRLRGEFACVPFGTARPVHGLTSEWESCKHEEAEGPPSGYAANSVWKLESQTSNSITISCEYPDFEPVRLVRKHIVAADSAIEVTLEVEARTAASIPLGMSAMFAVSARAQATTLMPGEFEFGSVFPGTFESGGSPTYRLSSGASFDSLRAVPRRVPPGPGVGDGDGADVAVDLSEVPLPNAQLEAMVQLCGSDGRFHVIRHDLDCTFTLEWDPTLLPSALLHISNNGRSYYPWSGAHSSVTVSPVASAFDLGTSVSSSDNPLKHRGLETCVEIPEGGSVSLTYKLSAHRGTRRPSGAFSSPAPAPGPSPAPAPAPAPTPVPASSPNPFDDLEEATTSLRDLDGEEEPATSDAHLVPQAAGRKKRRNRKK